MEVISASVGELARALVDSQRENQKLKIENAKLRAELAKFDQGNLLLQENGYPHLQVKE